MRPRAPAHDLFAMLANGPLLTGTQGARLLFHSFRIPFGFRELWVSRVYERNECGTGPLFPTCRLTFNAS